MYNENETLGGAKWRLGDHSREGGGKKMKKSEKKRVHLRVRGPSLHPLSSSPFFLLRSESCILTPCYDSPEVPLFDHRKWLPGHSPTIIART